MIVQVSARGEVSFNSAIRWYGISRQAYYQARQRELEQKAQEVLVIEWVRSIRQRHPRMGGRKLYHHLREPLRLLGIKRGRDQFFELLRTHDLLVPTQRSRRRTTYPGLWRCPNLLIDLPLTRPHQVWVADITYLTTEQGFLYLALLTDAYSRFIVGYDLSNSLATEGALRALNKAVEDTPAQRLNGLIHHSDHGIQYAAYLYCDRLHLLGIRSSMGQVGNCYDNALAERVNGILKIEYLLDTLFVSTEQARKTVDEAIYLYNFERPHLALDFATPAHFHQPNR